MRDAGLGKQIEELRPYRELWIIARWKLGGMLAKMVRGTGPGRGKKNSSGLNSFKSELARLGLTHQTANETQRLAALPEPELLSALKRGEDLPELGEMIRWSAASLAVVGKSSILKASLPNTAWGRFSPSSKGGQD